MIKLKFLFILIVCFACQAKICAQPGWAYKITGNLNDTDSTQIRKCIKRENLCYFGYITIDSTTNLSRLNHLNAARTLNLNVELKSLPKEFFNTKLDSIWSLNIGGKHLEDISNFPKMDNLEDLRVSGFKGDTLRIKNKLPTLKRIEIYDSEKIIDISNVLNNNKIEALSIHNCNNLAINNSASYNLKQLYIRNYRSTILKWEDIVYFKKLEYLSLSNLDFKYIPEGFPKSLKKIILSDGSTNLDTLNKLSELENMEELFLTNINIKWRKNM